MSLRAILRASALTVLMIVVMVPDRRARRKLRHIEMVFGRLIPLTEMVELGDLLRPYLGERMHDLHELDQ